MPETQKTPWPGWEVVGKIGKGSFGTVYEIQRDIYGDTVKAALKVITLPGDESEVDYLRCGGLDDQGIMQSFQQQVENIAREYKLMYQVRENPNVVRCEEFSDAPHTDGLGWDIYIKMELLTPLMKALDRVNTESQVIRLGRDLCNALAECHEKSIIHRDIKPQNVFVSENGYFKLGDFGIARTVEGTTRATAGIGTYSFMAPEVGNGGKYGKTTDIYSLGLLLHWLLNECRGPFLPLPPIVAQAGAENAARQRRFSGEPIPAPVHGSDALKQIVLKACAYDPGERYATAKEMLEALVQLGDGDKTEGSLGLHRKLVGDSSHSGLSEGKAQEHDSDDGKGNAVDPGGTISVFGGSGRARRDSDAPKESDPPKKERVRIRFLNDDETVLSSRYYDVGEKIDVPANPQKPDGNGVRYFFSRWSPRISECAQTAVDYRANYRAEPIAKEPPKLRGRKLIIAACALLCVIIVGAVGLSLKDGWLTVGADTTYYLQNFKKLTGWQDIDGARYYFTNKGEMAVGWLNMNSDYYYFVENGQMAIGWLNMGGDYYYFNRNGTMATGWRVISGDRYYFAEDGTMATGLYYINGVQYRFDAQGRLMG